MEHPTAADHINLSFAIKAIIDSVGPEGLVPSLLVYGTLPKLIVESGTLQDLDGRVRSMEAAKVVAVRVQIPLFPWNFREVAKDIASRLRMVHGFLMGPCCSRAQDVIQRILICRVAWICPPMRRWCPACVELTQQWCFRISDISNQLL